MVRRPENRSENRLLTAARIGRGLRSPAEGARELEAWAHTNGHLSFTCSDEKFKSWELGRIPQPYAWPVLIGYFGMTPEQLGLRPEPARLYLPPQAASTVEVASRVILDQETATHRREFIASTLAASTPAGPVPARVEMRHVRELADAVDTLRRQDHLSGGGKLAPHAVALVAHGHALLGATYTDRVGRALYSGIGELALLGGWLSFDRCDYGQARRLYNEALVAAKLAHDDPVAVHALANLAQHAQYQGRPREAIAYLRAARDTVGHWAPPPLRALLLSREAAQWAALGDLRQFERLAGEAREEFEAGACPETSWVAFVDTGELHMMEGNGLAAGGHTAQALTRFTLAANDTSERRPRNAVGRRLRLARAHVEAGDPRGGVEHADGVLDRLFAMDSVGLRESLSQFRQTLTAYQAHPAVAAFEARLADRVRA